MKNRVEDWRVYTSGTFLLLLFIIICILFIFSKTLALCFTLIALGASITHGITITDWKSK